MGRDGTPLLTRPICGDCLTCRPRTLRILRSASAPRLLPGAAPSAGALEKHATRFGTDQVAETAAEYGVSVAITRPKARRRTRGLSLKARIKGYVARGLSADDIAELEDLTPARAQRLVEEVCK